MTEIEGKVTTTKQTEANRRNAAKSTGPRTWKGKAVSRFNATRHGLTGRTVLLPAEDEMAFAALRDDILADLQPSSAVEVELAEHLVGLLWRLRRLGTVENGILAWEWFSELLERATAEAGSYRQDIVADAFTLMHTKVTDEEAEKRAQANAREAAEHRDADSLMLGCSFRRDAATADALGKLSRYQASLERSLFRTLRELRAARTVNEAT